MRVALLLGALLLIVWTAFPFLWILLTSFKTPGDINSFAAEDLAAFDADLTGRLVR